MTHQFISLVLPIDSQVWKCECAGIMGCSARCRLTFLVLRRKVIRAVNDPSAKLLAADSSSISPKVVVCLSVYQVEKLLANCLLTPDT